MPQHSPEAVFNHTDWTAPSLSGYRRDGDVSLACGGILTGYAMRQWLLGGGWAAPIVRRVLTILNLCKAFRKGRENAR